MNFKCFECSKELTRKNLIIHDYVLGCAHSFIFYKNDKIVKVDLFFYEKGHKKIEIRNDFHTYTIYTTVIKDIKIPVALNIITDPDGKIRPDLMVNKFKSLLAFS